jgi:PAS domain S-box-containing protein
MATDKDARSAGTGRAGDQGDWTAPPIDDLARFWELSVILLGVGDYDGNLRHLNRAYQEALGWSAAELTSVPWWEFLHPDERDDLADLARQLMDHGQVRLGDTVRMLCRDGRYKWVRWNNGIDPERQLFYAAGIDISDTRDCQDRVTVGTWEWQPATGTLTYSPELADLVDLPAQCTTTTGSFLERIHPDDRARVTLRARDSRTTGEPFTQDFRVLRADHSVRWLHAAGSADRNPHRPVHRLRGIAIDVTARKNQGRI